MEGEREKEKEEKEREREREGGRAKFSCLQVCVCGCGWGRGGGGSTSSGEAKKPSITGGASVAASERARWAPSCPSPEALVLFTSTELFTFSK